MTSHEVVVEDMYPLTPLQEGMLFHAVHDSGECAADGAGVYVETFRRRYDRLDVDRLGAAWRAVARSHPVLRSAFLWEETDRPVQVVLADADLPFAVVDRHRPAPFALADAPLTRVELVELGGGAYELVWTYHHLLLDGWSAALVLADVERAYAGRELDPPRPFRDFVSWLARRDRSGDRAFWEAELRGVTAPTPLPFGARAGTTPGPYATVRAELPAALSSALTVLARRRRITVASIARSAWAVVLARHAGVDDVVFGVTVSGRPPELDGVEQMVGLFINTVPTRVPVDPLAPIGAWLDARHQDWARLRDHEHAALTDIRRASAIEAPAPLFESLFVFESYPDRARLAGGAIEERSNLPLTVAVAGRPGRMQMVLHHDTAVLDVEQARLLAEQLKTVLTGLTGNPDLPVAALPLLTRAELARDQAAAEHAWPAMHDAVPPPDCCLHELVEAWARRTPTAVAVRHGGRALTYAELDRRADALARRLTDAGVGPDELSAVCLPRGLDLVLALLAVLKAGGGYVPLDPRQPRARLDLLRADADPAVWIDEAWLGVEPAPGPRARRPARQAGPGDVAYVIYTSGSTGRPKGVAVEHRAIVAYLRWAAATYGSAGGAVSHSPAGFDLALTELFVPLVSGETLVIADDLQELLLEPGPPHRLALLKTTPAQAAVLGEGTAPSVQARVLVLGGEQLYGTQAVDLARLLGSELVVNEYGPTEATVGCCVFAAEPGALAAGPAPIGRPVAGARLRVLDRFLEPVPSGVAGELYIGGAGLARGYLGRPGLTAERFVPDPFGPPGARLYRTGDVVRRRADGELEYLGRRDRQVKIRGHRVEPGEVEAALGGDALVVPRDGRLVAYVRRPVDVARLRDVLPDHLIPSAVVQVDAWPLTANGKVDRAALPAAGPPVLRPDRPPAPPRTAAEQALAAIWSAVLDLPTVGVDDDFFALGGDSITAIHVVARARRAGLAIVTRDLFAGPTVRQLATTATASGRPAGGATAGPVPLTPVQAWFFGLDLPVPEHWNQSVLARCPGPLSAPRLRAALDSLVARHDALRLRFDGPAQRLEESAPPVRLVEADEQNFTAAVEQAHAGLDLAAGRLLAAVLQGARLFLTAHHLAVDLVSWPVLVEDLQALYEGTPPGPPTVSFATWARSRPAAPVISRPADSGPSARWQSVVEGAASREAVVAALVRALAVVHGAEQVRIDLEGHGRDGAEDLSRTVGWFTRLSSLVVDTQHTEQPANTLRRVTPLLAQPGEHLPGADVVLNYLGRPVPPPPGGWAFAPGPGANRAPANGRPYAVEINCARVPGGLEMTIIHGSDDWTAALPAELARQLGTLADAASWFAFELDPLPGVESADLDAVLDELGLGPMDRHGNDA